MKTASAGRRRRPKSKESRRVATVALAASFAVAALVAPARARADGTPHDQKAAAQVLFEQARALVEQSQFAEACPKFAESQRLDPGIGTLLWLADCYENVGQTASAWASFKEAAAAAALRHDERENVARQRATNLEPKLSRLTIDVPPQAAVSGLEIRRDGVPIGTAEWNLALPVNPGNHTIAAQAPGRKAWSTTVDVAPDGQTTPVSIGALEPIPPPAPKPTPAADVPEPPPATEAESPEPEEEKPAEASDPHRGNGQRIAGASIAGLGLAGIVVGTVFSFRAKATYDESNQNGNCLPDNECNATGKADRSRAESMALVATVAMSAGLAAVAGGAIVFFVAPKPAPASVAFAPSPAGGGLRVTWAW